MKIKMKMKRSTQWWVQKNIIIDINIITVNTKECTKISICISIYMYICKYGVRACDASAAAASAVSAVGFSNIKCTVNNSESRDSEYSGLMSTFCRLSSTTSHGRNAAEGSGSEGGGGRGDVQGGVSKAHDGGWGSGGNKELNEIIKIIIIIIISVRTCVVLVLKNQCCFVPRHRVVSTETTHNGKIT